jgi:hypothetical protein
VTSFVNALAAEAVALLIKALAVTFLTTLLLVLAFSAKTPASVVTALLLIAIRQTAARVQAHLALCAAPTQALLVLTQACVVVFACPEFATTATASPTVVTTALFALAVRLAFDFGFSN